MHSQFQSCVQLAECGIPQRPHSFSAPRQLPLPPCQAPAPRCPTTPPGHLGGEPYSTLNPTPHHRPQVPAPPLLPYPPKPPSLSTLQTRPHDPPAPLPGLRDCISPPTRPAHPPEMANGRLATAMLPRLPVDVIDGSCALVDVPLTPGPRPHPPTHLKWATRRSRAAASAG